MMANKNIDKLLENARFDLTTEEREMFEKDYESFLKSLDLLEKIDLSAFERQIRPLNQKNRSDVLRSDEVIFNNAWRVKEQASATEDGYILLKEGK